MHLSSVSLNGPFRITLKHLVFRQYEELPIIQLVLFR